MLVGMGYVDRYLSESEIRDLFSAGMNKADLAGKKVLIIIPDSTRTAPIPQMFQMFFEYLGGDTAALDYLIALGTHKPLSDAAILRLVGISEEDRRTRYSKIKIFNHRWDLPETFVSLGEIPGSEIQDLTCGLMSQSVEVRLNRLVFEYDQIIVCGPTFPHEVVGFSGGNKYFFPGIGGEEVINFSHWLGAVLTNYSLIGTKHTPVRKLIDRAASLIDRPKLCFSLVVKHESLAGLYIGSPEEAYEAAADLSSKLHVVWVDKPFKKVLSVMPSMYDDIWTAAKGMYKMEPAIADDGEVIIYAPHISEISYSHGHLLDKIGYHVRDYFLKQWPKFKHYPGGVLAHSTHLRGMGNYEPTTQTETGRIRVTLATQIPKERCRKVNLAYLDPSTVNVERWAEEECEDALMVPRAGEMLYRLRP